jgi:hypothetical protein
VLPAVVFLEVVQQDVPVWAHCLAVDLDDAVVSGVSIWATLVCVYDLYCAQTLKFTEFSSGLRLGCGEYLLAIISRFLVKTAVYLLPAGRKT